LSFDDYFGSCLCLQITAGGFHSLASGEDGQRATELGVMIKIQLGLGAGIIMGQKNDRVYIATANHGVRLGTDYFRPISPTIKL
jgi:hypothetical protein